MDSSSFISSHLKKEEYCESLHSCPQQPVLRESKELVLFQFMNIGAEPTEASCTTAETSGGISSILAVPSHPILSHPILQALGTQVKRDHHPAMVYRKKRARLPFAAQ